jgi:hypothetical protein
MGASDTRLSLRPLFSGGTKFMHTSGASRRGIERARVRSFKIARPGVLIVWSMALTSKPPGRLNGNEERAGRLIGTEPLLQPNP